MWTKFSRFWMIGRWIFWKRIYFCGKVMLYGTSKGDKFARMSIKKPLFNFNDDPSGFFNEFVQCNANFKYSSRRIMITNVRASNQLDDTPLLRPQPHRKYESWLSAVNLHR